MSFPSAKESKAIADGVIDTSTLECIFDKIKTAREREKGEYSCYISDGRFNTRIHIFLLNKGYIVQNDSRDGNISVNISWE